MQVKSKQRVADHGEVFTNEREVKAMVDLVNDMAVQIEKTFLEPACGSGNFLVEILQRKLNTLYSLYHKSQIDYDYNLLIAVSSIYGVELLQDNAKECRERLLHQVKNNYPKKYRQSKDYDALMKSVEYILSKNIINGNALDYKTAEGKPIYFTEWGFVDRMVKQRLFDFEMILNPNTGKQLGLFSDAGDPADIVEPSEWKPLTHYLKLYQNEKSRL